MVTESNRKHRTDGSGWCDPRRDGWTLGGLVAGTIVAVVLGHAMAARATPDCITYYGRYKNPPPVAGFVPCFVLYPTWERHAVPGGAAFDGTGDIYVTAHYVRLRGFTI